MSEPEKKPDGDIVEEAKVSPEEEAKPAESESAANDKASPTGSSQKGSAKADSKPPAKKAKVSAADVEASSSADDKEGKVEDESDEEEEPRLGLLEKPIEIESGKRERKKVERLSEQLSAAVASPSEKKSAVAPEGSGQKLGDCPEIEHEIQKQGADDLKTLHRVLFGRPGAATEVKRNIRRFCGFTFEKDSDEYNKKLDFLLRSTTTQSLKALCGILAQERSGTKEQMAERVVDFLLCPKSSGKLPKKSKRGRGKGKRKPRATGSGGDAKEGQKRKSKASDEQADNKDDSGSDADGEADDSGTVSKAEDGDDDEPAASKASEKAEPKESPKKKAESKSPKKDAPKVRKTKPKESKEPKAKAARKTKSADVKEAKATKKRAKSGKGDGGGNSDDEPLQKKVKKEPSEDELRKLIKKILDSANLEEVTMKTVIKKVFNEYPDVELSPKKEFIKDTVKQILGA